MIPFIISLASTQLDVDRCSTKQLLALPLLTSNQCFQHVHFHILPRKPADIPNNDDVYRELATHDQDIQAINRRSEEEMNREAAELRHYFL